MNPTIIAENKDHLKKLIEEEIKLNGRECDLNHIDVSQLIDMSYLFGLSSFNGNISKWDVSKVQDMSFMFTQSKFDGDISQWNISNVSGMGGMFFMSDFNSDISNWDVSNVSSMTYMFAESKFKKDLSNWEPREAQINNIFDHCLLVKPYWAEFENKKVRKIAINKYKAAKELSDLLQNGLSDNNSSQKKIKI
jgi:surface protein